MNAARAFVGVAICSALLAGTSRAQSVEDGLYLVDPGGAGPSIETAEGRTVSLGERLTIPADAVHYVRSLDNANTDFDVSINGVAPPIVLPGDGIAELLRQRSALPNLGEGKRPDFALVVAGEANIGGGRPLISFHFLSEARAMPMAEFLDVPIALHHCQISVCGHTLRARSVCVTWRPVANSPTPSM